MPKSNVIFPVQTFYVQLCYSQQGWRYWLYVLLISTHQSFAVFHSCSSPKKIFNSRCSFRVLHVVFHLYTAEWIHQILHQDFKEPRLLYKRQPAVEILEGKTPSVLVLSPTFTICCIASWNKNRKRFW